MRTLSLRVRIAVLFLALLALVQIVTLLLVNAASYDAARARISDELDVGERVFQRLMSQDAERLSQAARALAADFAFREAVSGGDAQTIVSALENLGSRVRAAATLYVDLHGTVVAGTFAPEARKGFGQFGELIADARRTGGAHQILLINDRAYQVVAVPVRAPVTIGWVLLCFPVDMARAQELQHLTGLDVSFVAGRAGEWRSLGSTLPPGEVAGLRDALSANGVPTRSWVVEREGGMRQGRALDIGIGTEGKVLAVLERPMEPALKYWRELRSLLLGLGAISLVLSAVFSVLIARGVTRPLDRLLECVRSIRSGNYELKVTAERDDEIGAVARGLDHMRLGIREREHRILTLAYQDTLTLLPNRARLNDELAAALGMAAANATPVSVVLLGLDRFRSVNDVLGHGAGDEVLAQLGARLRAVSQPGSCVARLGGDEFAILLPDTSAAAALLVARGIQQVLEQPFMHQDQPVDVRASIGIAAFPVHGGDPQTLLRNADIAMYAAKQSKAGIATFDPAIDDAQKDHLSLLGELRLAVERNELEVHYQPKVDLGSGHVGAAEALLRWRHPVRGRVPPGVFIPFAEQTGYVKVLTRWVLREVVRQCSEWQARGCEIQVAVNLSARDLMSEDLPDFIRGLLAEHDLPAYLLRLEVTESGFLDDPQRARQVLVRLAQAGHSISVDDYGTGYSSLTYLRQLPVDELKIDRSFIAGIAVEPNLAVIVRSTIEMGHGLGMKIVAEGVEDDDVRRRLMALGCDAIQGYLISPPLDAGAFERWLSGALPERAVPDISVASEPTATLAFGRAG